MINFEKETLTESIKVNGGTLKKVICMEECSELIKEVSKDLRGKLDRAHLIEECGDVLICIENLKIMYGIKDEELQEAIDFKVERQKQRDREKKENEKSIERDDIQQDR